MAEGRMLKRNISESRRLSELKTDSARLLWTWILPFLDSEGRYYASPTIIKGKIVPRLKSFSERKIKNYIEDMARVGLVFLYESDGEKLLQFRNFDKFQKIKKDREAEPLPAPLTPDQLPTESGVDPDQVGSESRPLVCKGKEEKGKEVKAKGNDQQQPVDNSPAELPLEEKTEEQGDDEVSFDDFNPGNGNGQKQAFLDTLKQTIGKIADKFPSQRDQQAALVFVQSHITKGNPDAIQRSLESLLKAEFKIDDKGKGVVVKAYLEAAFKQEDGNYNARDHDRKAAVFKRPMTKGELNSLGDIFAAAARGKT